MQCLGCQKQRDAKRLPPGWHRTPAGSVLCGSCWNERYMLRAVTIPVAGPVGCDWPELREKLKVCFRGATRLSNWAVSELAKADVTRTADQEKLPKQQKPYLYPGAREQCPELDTGSVVSILHAVEGRYASRRYDVVWLAKESLPNYRYDRAVYPVRSRDWKAIRGGDGERLVSVRLAGTRLSLRLRGGHQFRRQAAAFDKLLSDDAIASELSVYEISGSNGDNRPGTDGRDDGGQRAPKRLMCKMCMWLPREPKVERSGTLFIRTDADALLIALDTKGERIWIEHCDQLKRWEAEHRRKLQRWSDDQKAEQRPTASYQSRRERSVLKYQRRLDSLCHEVASHVARFAARRRYAAIKYDDSVQDYVGRFPWAKLRGLVEQKLDERGIGFERSIAEKKAATSRGDAKKEQ